MDATLLDQLTAKYGEIYLIEVAGKEYAYRSLTLAELENFERLSESAADLEDIYVQHSVVYPIDFDLGKMKAGHVSSLADAISQVSGLSADFILRTLDNYRQEAVEDVLIKIKAMVLAAMPVYTDDYINTLTIKQLLQKLVLSEEILTIQQAVNGIQTESGIKLDIAPVATEAPSSQKAKVSMSAVDKETLLRRIMREDAETANQFDTQQPADYDKLKDFDTDILAKAAGYIDQDDPIARKLRKVMGG